jgi:hypothetical protein
MVPELPLNVTLAFPVGAVDVTVTATLIGIPGVSTNVDGVTTTPAVGIVVTVTGPMKPLIPVAETLTFAELVWTSVIVGGWTDSVKSGVAVTLTVTGAVRVPAMPGEVPVKTPVNAISGAVDDGVI